jgi:hypothetical protein
VHRVVIVVLQMQQGRERVNQVATHVAGELVRPAEEHRGFWIIGALIFGVPGSEVVRAQAEGGRAMGDAVIQSTPDERDIARDEFERRVRVVEPHPGMAPDDGVDGELDGAGKA